MNSEKPPLKAIGYQKKLLSAVAIALALGVAFWAGHQLWTEDWQQSGAIMPQLSSGLPRTAVPPAVSGHGIALGESSIADLAADAVKSVVNIDTRTSIAIPDLPFQFGGPFGGFEFFFGQEMPVRPAHPRRFESQGTGSGVIIRPDGYILTNNHVVRQANEIKVTLADKRVFRGRIVGRDSFTDLALIKIDASGLPVARLGSSKQLRPGDWAVAIGSPLGLDHSVTLGIISALGRSVADLKSNVELIQTDAAINPGNSGGPLLNIRGEVIGINTAIRSDAQNIGFAIPVDVARGVVNGLLAHGTVQRPYVGIYMQELEPRLAKSLGLSATTRGVVVARVAPESPAEKAGLTAGDVIERVDGQSVDTAKVVQKLVRAHKVGDQLNLLVSRNGTLTAVNVKVDEYPLDNKEDKPNDQQDE